MDEMFYLTKIEELLSDVEIYTVIKKKPYKNFRKQTQQHT